MSARGWRPSQIPGTPPKGAYSRGVRAGDLLFISGQVPRSFETGGLVGSDVGEQTRTVIENIARVLESEGLDLGDLVSVNAYLADIADWEAFDAVYRLMIPPPFPTRTTVGADLHGVLVEMSAIAAFRSSQ